jgi:aquaporin Z
MGATAVALIYSPWGKRSGAHLNPSVTLAFLKLRKIEPVDAVFYVVAQFAGGLVGVILARGVLGQALSEIGYATTVPGPPGAAAAFLAEAAISFVLMTVVLNAAGDARVSRFTGVLAGALIVVFIGLEAPISGMSMNPARTVASAAPAGVWTGWWLYLAAPPGAMALAATLHERIHGQERAPCAKLHHSNRVRCIFCERPS